MKPPIVLQSKKTGNTITLEKKKPYEPKTSWKNVALAKKQYIKSLT